jgi:hypothetical protein
MIRATSGEMIRGALRMVVGFALLVLLAGVWACLWVPPSI